eukprot:jgi/Bigna1/84393/fgenesh1_pg.133_\
MSRGGDSQTKMLSSSSSSSPSSISSSSSSSSVSSSPPTPTQSTSPTTPSSSNDVTQNGIDIQQCLKKGLVGAIGVIPGTVAAHPFDVIKIRMQTSKDSLRMAMGTISKTTGGFKGFYRGLSSAVQQKMITCGPMFLISEICTQGMQLAGMKRAEACFAGSAVSGYSTGFVAALSEYRKVLLSQNVKVPGGGTWTYSAVYLCCK